MWSGRGREPEDGWMYGGLLWEFGPDLYRYSGVSFLDEDKIVQYVELLYVVYDDIKTKFRSRLDVVESCLKSLRKGVAYRKRYEHDLIVARKYFEKLKKEVEKFLLDIKKLSRVLLKNDSNKCRANAENLSGRSMMILDFLEDLDKRFRSLYKMLDSWIKKIEIVCSSTGGMLYCF